MSFTPMGEFARTASFLRDGEKPAEELEWMAKPGLMFTIARSLFKND